MGGQAVNLIANEPLLILEPGRAEKNYWRDLWRYRELFLILAWRDISVRYKQTIIGVAWAIKKYTIGHQTERGRDVALRGVLAQNAREHRQDQRHAIIAVER